MNVLTLNAAKRHLRIDHDDEDELIEDDINAAVGIASDFIGRSIPWLDDEGNNVPVPHPVTAAIKLILGDLYEQRQNSVVGTIYTNTKVAETILSPYRIDLAV